MSKKEISKTFCECCEKRLPNKDFTRISAETGLKEKGFFYCNKCINNSRTEKFKAFNKR